MKTQIRKFRINKRKGKKMSGVKIRAMRKARNIKQSELAERVGVTQSFISQVELRGASCHAKTLKAIARALRCKVEDLTGVPEEYEAFIQNCKGLSSEQLLALNEVALLFKQTDARG
jgi:transcriptional regulator with XRE-family HTH domain